MMYPARPTQTEMRRCTPKRYVYASGIAVHLPCRAGECYETEWTGAQMKRGKLAEVDAT